MADTVARLRALLAEATPGPWRPEREPEPAVNAWFDAAPTWSTPIESRGTAFALGVAVGASARHADAALIAAAVNALPALLDVVGAARELVRQELGDDPSYWTKDRVAKLGGDGFGRPHIFHVALEAHRALMRLDAALQTEKIVAERTEP